MIDSIVTKLLEHGSWGIIVVLLLYAVNKLWDRFNACQDTLLTQALLWQKTLQDNTKVIESANEAHRRQADVIAALSEANRAVASELSRIREELSVALRGRAG